MKKAIYSGLRGKREKKAQNQGKIAFAFPEKHAYNRLYLKGELLK
jgi:hypothetical protein